MSWWTWFWIWFLKLTCPRCWGTRRIWSTSASAGSAFSSIPQSTPRWLGYLTRWRREAGKSDRLIPSYHPNYSSRFHWWHSPPCPFGWTWCGGLRCYIFPKGPRALRKREERKRARVLLLRRRETWSKECFEYQALFSIGSTLPTFQ